MLRAHEPSRKTSNDHFSPDPRSCFVAILCVGRTVFAETGKGLKTAERDDNGHSGVYFLCCFCVFCCLCGCRGCGGGFQQSIHIHSTCWSFASQAPPSSPCSQAPSACVKHQMCDCRGPGAAPSVELFTAETWIKKLPIISSRSLVSSVCAPQCVLRQLGSRIENVHNRSRHHNIRPTKINFINELSRSLVPAHSVIN